MEIETYLPHAGRRYAVSQSGKVTDSVSGDLIQTKFINNQHFVKLEWLFGKAYYPVGLLMLVSFGKIGLPDHLYNEIEILYSDSNANNLEISNLLYRFKNGPLMVEDYPNFYYIPMHSDYAISRNGILINVHSGRQKVWSKTKPGEIKNQKGGYYYNRTVNDDGKSVTLFRHRALCLVFKKYEHDVKSKYVNHKDGVPGNDTLSNLEWATPKENNDHAFLTGLRGDNKPVAFWDLVSGEKKQFISIARCAAYLTELINDGVDRRGLVTERLKKKEFTFYQDMWLFKYDNGEPWPEVDIKTLTIRRVGKPNNIVARNVFTKTVVIFKGVPEAAEYTQLETFSIHSHIRNDKKTPTSGWLFRYKDSVGDVIDWPEFNEFQLRIFKEYPKYPPVGVFVYDDRSGKETFYTSVSSAIRVLKMTKSVIWKYIKKGKTPDGRYSFRIQEVNPVVSLRK